jgi:hypothetical protein
VLIAALHGDWGEAQGNYDELRFFTGLRPSEEIALVVTDYDAVHGVLSITKARVLGIDKDVCGAPHVSESESDGGAQSAPGRQGARAPAHDDVVGLRGVGRGRSGERHRRNSRRNEPAGPDRAEFDPSLPRTRRLRRPGIRLRSRERDHREEFAAVEPDQSSERFGSSRPTRSRKPLENKENIGGKGGNLIQNLTA